MHTVYTYWTYRLYLWSSFACLWPHLSPERRPMNPLKLTVSYIFSNRQAILQTGCQASLYQLIDKWETHIFIPPPNKVGKGILESPCSSVHPSTHPSVSLQLTWFLEHNSSLLWNFNFKFHVHIECGHRQKPVNFQWHLFQNGCLVAILDSLVSRLWFQFGFEYQLQTSVARYLCVWVIKLSTFSNVPFKMHVWRSYRIFTRGQLWPFGIVVACVCPCWRQSRACSS